MDTAQRISLAKSIDLQYDTELPIVQRREEIADLIRSHQVVVVCGETGSGKSTQLPKICLEIGRGIHGIIGHTQPRRIAARTIAARVAEELQSTLGTAVGYKVRFDEKLAPNTLIKLMTDGILLAESQNDRNFQKYDTIIIDEAHERSLNIDFLIGMMKRVLPQRQDLKLIITSATIDAQRFAEHFTAPKINHNKPVPVIEVSGRTYPIDILYRNPDSLDNDDDVSRETDTMQRSIIAAVDEIMTQRGGDILIFIPTERDILETSKLLKHYSTKESFDVLPLYARLPVNQQQKVFQKSPRRKIVLATNVAESSLTVPGIRYVIDTGTARLSRYSPRTRTQRLPIEAVSQASADQRAGRCGRVGPGVCFRLYSELDYKHRERYTTPEIQRTNLASVILQTLALKLGHIETFPFLDPPKSTAVSDGFKTLFEIGAIDEHRQLTPIGRQLSRLPVDPRIGRMILAAKDNNVLHELLIIAAALEVQDPRERPPEFSGKADAAHAKFLDSRSDYLAYLKIWEFFQHLKETTSRNGLRKACQQNFLSFNRLKEWSDIHLELLRETKILANGVAAKSDIKPQVQYEAIHRSILAGNLSGIAQRDNKIEYTVCNNAGKFVLWPGSGLRKGQPNKAKQKDSPPSLPHWLLAAERVETSRRYLRTVAQIDERWIEPAAKHLIKRVYLEPHWNSETGYVHAFEKVSLLGIVIVPKRRINYGPIDTKTARDIFIQAALVEGDLNTELDFFHRNQQVIDEAKKMQDKVRHHDLLKPETFRYQFYQERIPESVYDKRSLEKWLKNSPDDAAGLRFKLSDVCTDLADTSAFPDKLQSFAIEYKYAPGETQDGLTVVVPQKELPQLEPAKLGWLVPGLLEQKLVVLLKSLPKDIRRTIVPIPDTVRQLMKIIPFGDGELEERVCKEITKLAGRIVVRSHFNVEQIPPELQMNVRVLNDSGEAIGEGRNFAVIRKQFAPAAVHSNRTAVQTDAEVFHGKHQREIRLQVIHLPNVEKLRMYVQPLPEFQFDDDVGLFIASRACQSNIPSAVQEVTKMLTAFLEAYHDTRKTLEQYTKTAIGTFRDACADVKENIQRLLPRGFLVTVPWNWLTEYPRYFKAVPLRFEKLCNGGEAADRSGTAELQRYWQQYIERKELHEAAGLDDIELETFRWMLEEYRVSLFAQRLGTAVKVSPQRLAKQFEKVQQ